MDVRAKREAIRRMDTEALQYICDNLGGNEDKPQSPEYPLGGLVHLTGIGQVQVTWLREELACRT